MVDKQGLKYPRSLGLVLGVGVGMGVGREEGFGLKKIYLVRFS